ncbi:MAG: hypothetical protein AAF694_17745 [Bacteroidota bacterium]
MPEPKRILFLASNPADTGRLRFDKEHKEISESIRRSKYRDFCELDEAFAVSARDIARKILDVRPHIIHFTGHGTRTGKLVAEKAEARQMLGPNALGNLLSSFSDTVELVILNACYSERSAEAILKHIPFVIGMRDAIQDQTAIDFAIGLYDAFGDRGYDFTPQNLDWAVNFAKNIALIEGATDADLPVLQFNQALIGRSIPEDQAADAIPKGIPGGSEVKPSLDTIQKTVIEEGLKAAGDELFGLMEQQSFGRKDKEIIHLVSRINSFHKDVMGNILKTEEIQVREAKLMASFTSLLEYLK